LAETQHNVAISLRHMGQLEHAEDRERQAIGYASEARDPMLESLARLGLGELALEKGDAALAEAIARHAAKRFAADGNALREADALRVVGAACLAQQKLRDARDVLRRALELAVANGARLLEAEIRRLNVELLLTSGHREAAATEAHEAARLFEKLGSPSKAQECRNRLL
jgi:tetratricopeptide (TPR) repeat protein